MLINEDRIVHVSFEAGITLPDGSTAQSVALAGDDSNVPAMGGVKRVKDIEQQHFGIVLVGEAEITLVPWAKVRQCKLRRRQVNVGPAAAELRPARESEDFVLSGAIPTVENKAAGASAVRVDKVKTK